MTKHAHRASNLANEDVNLVGMFDQTWSVLHGSLTVMTFEFDVTASVLLVKH